MYSETCLNDHLYPGTTSLERPLSRVPIVLVHLIPTSVKRPSGAKSLFAAQRWGGCYRPGFTAVFCMNLYVHECFLLQVVIEGL